MLEMGHLVDDDRPTAEALRLLEEWPVEDPAGFLGLAKTLFVAMRCSSAWEARGGTRVLDLDEDETPIHQDRGHPALVLVTGGWSGADDVIAAMRKNRSLWVFCHSGWRAGGRWEFDRRTWGG